MNAQRTDIDVLKEKLGKKRIILNDDQRRCLAVKGKALGRKVLEEIGALPVALSELRNHLRDRYSLLSCPGQERLPLSRRHYLSKPAPIPYNGGIIDRKAQDDSLPAGPVEVQTTH